MNMRSKTARFFQAASIFALGIGGGTKPNNAAEQKQDASQAAQLVQQSDADALHSITLPHYEPSFPAAAGREEFVTACVVCHSPRYITMQPRFARSTWLSEVKKMKNVYGAHISDQQAEKITDYLVFINGKKDEGNVPQGTYGE